MSVRLYMNAHVRSQVTSGLRRRGVDVLTAQEDGCDRLPDPELLDRATQLGRVLFTQDEDLLAEGAKRQRAAQTFAGIVYAHQKLGIGTCIGNLELIALASEPADLVNGVLHLPL